MAVKKKQDTYDESNIKILKGLDGIRKRPTMYIGAIGQDGVFHLFREAIDNSLDEALEGFCTKINIEVNAQEGFIKVSDNGRGIPIGSIEDSFLKIHSSGKFDENAYAYSAGLNGVGNKAINALSTETIVTVKRDGYIHQAKFSKGKIVSPLKKGKATKETGTSTKFYPDIEILKDVTIEIERYRTFMRHISYLNKGIEFNFKATTKDGKSTIEKYYSKNGIKDFAKDLQKSPLKGTKIIYLEGTENGIPVEVAIAYTKGDEEINRAFCNGIENIEGGTHATGFRMGLSSVVTKYINDNKLIPKKEGKLEITGEDCREGVIAIISIKHKNALFSSQQKIRLTNTDAQGAVMKIVNSQLAEYFKIHKDEAKIICEKAILAAKGRNAAKRARLNTKKAAESFSSISNLSKFTQCSSKDPELRELYIMEGNKAELLS